MCAFNREEEREEWPETRLGGGSFRMCWGGFRSLRIPCVDLCVVTAKVLGIAGLLLRITGSLSVFSLEKFSTV